MKIRLASPRGFCAGVDRAIEIVERALVKFGPPVYVRHEVVHNRRVVEDLRSRGVVFVDEVAEVPEGAVVIFSAHGVSRAVRGEADGRDDLTVFDATCPLVTKVHIEVSKFERQGRETILIGHAGHPEVEGTLGQMRGDAGARMYLVEDVEQAARLDVANPERLAFVTQTTLSLDDTREIVDTLTARFPDLKKPRKDDICYATQNRQDAVRELARESDVVLVVGSVNSSNSNRLRELAARIGARAYLIDGADEIAREWVGPEDRVGVTSGASAPEHCVVEVIRRLQSWGGELIESDAPRAEDIEFSLPRGLREP